MSAKTKTRPMKVWARCTKTGIPMLGTMSWRKSTVGWMHDIQRVERFSVTLDPPRKPRRKG